MLRGRNWKKKTNQENDKTIAIKIMRTKNGLKTRYKKIPRDEIEKNNKKV